MNQLQKKLKVKVFEVYKQFVRNLYEDCKKGLNNLKEVHNIYKMFVRILKTHGRCQCEKHKMFIRNAREVSKKYLISF